MTDNSDRLVQLLCNTILSEVRLDQPDLSMRQLAILLTVYGTDELQTVRRLAGALNLSGQAVTRSINRLSEFDLMQRRAAVLARRSALVTRTEAGTAMMQRLAHTMAAAAKAAC